MPEGHQFTVGLDVALRDHDALRAARPFVSLCAKKNTITVRRLGNIGSRMPEGHQFTVGPDVYVLTIGLDVAMTPCGPRGSLCHCVQKRPLLQ